MYEIDWKKVVIIGVSAAAIIALMYVLIPVFRSIFYTILLICLLMLPVILPLGLIALIVYLARR